MSYQKCPICNGEGYTYNYGITSYKSKCDTCNGEKIISELTGLPPTGNIDEVKGSDLDIKEVLKTGFDGSVIPGQKQ